MAKTKRRRGTTRGGQGQGQGQGVCGAQIQLLMGGERRLEMTEDFEGDKDKENKKNKRKHNYKAEESDGAEEDKGQFMYLNRRG